MDDLIDALAKHLYEDGWHGTRTWERDSENRADYQDRARQIIDVIMGHFDGTNLYRTVWAIIEEFIVEGPTIDLNTAEGLARMQVVCALLTTAIHNPHDLDLEGPR